MKECNCPHNIAVATAVLIMNERCEQDHLSVYIMALEREVCAAVG
jgi:hypothetical protein